MLSSIHVECVAETAFVWRAADAAAGTAAQGKGVERAAGGAKGDADDVTGTPAAMVVLPPPLLPRAGRLIGTVGMEHSAYSGSDASSFLIHASQKMSAYALFPSGSCTTV